MSLLDDAVGYLNAGLCVLPAIRLDKRPALPGWKRFQDQLPTERQVRAWFTGDGENAKENACCLLTGAISGNLELLDFDCDRDGKTFERWRAIVARESPGLYERLVIERSQSGGWHVVYRCESSVPGNRKLAQRRIPLESGDPIEVGGKQYVPRRVEDHFELTFTLIETRGEGGLFLCAPTPGYVLEQGSLDRLPVLSDAERSVLIEAARSLNEVAPADSAPCPGIINGRPGDAFNERGDIRELLRKHGWKQVRGGANEHWRRPGKTNGWSATLKNGVFHVFSTNAAPFEAERSYAPFSVYALLEHAGDFKQAAIALREMGFGNMKNDDVDLSGILASARSLPVTRTSRGIAVVQMYNDGPDFPVTPLLQAAERAYRDGFQAIASLATQWQCPPEELRQELWENRRAARQRAEVLVPSAELFGMPEMDSEQVRYRVGHDVDAARARGQVQACEIAFQCWEALEDRGVPDEAIAPLFLKPWNEAVQAWADKQIVATKISPPPRPEETLSETQMVLIDQFFANANRDEPIGSDPESLLPTKSVRQLLNEFPSLRRPVIHGLLREGETMNVIASPKVGKSWLVVDLALAVATGQSWLNLFPCEAGEVLIVDNELHRETSAHRVPKIMAARGVTLDAIAERVYVANVRGELKDIFSMGRYFEQIEPGRFKLIILDAFYRFMPRDSDENDNGTMSQVYNHLDGYAARLGCSFVLVHHSTKGSQSGKSVTDVGAGAGSQSRATDTHLVLRPHAEKECVVLDAAVRSWPPIAPRGLRWTFPVWTPDDSLDPEDLRLERPRRKAKPVDEGAKTAASKKQDKWDAARFASEFVTDVPATILDLIERAKDANLSERKAGILLKQAEREGLIYRWKFGATIPVQLATIPQVETPR